MIDTLTLYKQGRNSKDFDLNLKKFQSHLSESGQINNYTNNFKDKDKRNIYVKYDLNNDYLLLTFSAPKLIYGNSINEIEVKDKDKIVKTLTERLSGIVESDFENMQVSRLDVSKNIQVDLSTSHYITALKQSYDITNGRYRLTTYKDESLTVSNNSRRFVIYDKIIEQLQSKELSKSESKQYGNILRLETQHKKSQHIKTSFNRSFYLSELFTDKQFNDFKTFQLEQLNKFYCNYGQYDLFLQDVSMMDLICNYNKRNPIKNFLIKKFIPMESIDFELLKDVLTPYQTKQGINKAIKELRKLYQLSNKKVYDLLDEIRTKMTA
jgi:hypothetical protein